MLKIVHSRYCISDLEVDPAPKLLTDSRGNYFTLTVQGQVGGILGTYDSQVDPSQDGHHTSLSVLQ